jgi:hypothetical protein
VAHLTKNIDFSSDPLNVALLHNLALVENFDGHGLEGLCVDA